MENVKLKNKNLIGVNTGNIGEWFIRSIKKRATDAKFRAELPKRTFMNILDALSIGLWICMKGSDDNETKAPKQVSVSESQAYDKLSNRKRKNPVWTCCLFFY